MQFTKDTIDLFIQTMRNYGWMDLPSYSMSMYPFIKKGNICRFVAFELDKVKKGDVLLYHSSSGQLVAHRFLQVREIDNQLQFVLKGDSNTSIDEPICSDQIIGKLVTIDNDKRKIYTSDYTATFWSYLISTYPVFSKALGTYLRFKSRIKTRFDVSL
jgi:signal peptidase I